MFFSLSKQLLKPLTHKWLSIQMKARRLSSKRFKHNYLRRRKFAKVSLPNSVNEISVRQTFDESQYYEKPSSQLSLGIVFELPEKII